MPHVFDISLPFDVTEVQYGIGEYPPICKYAIPLAQTTVYKSELITGFEFARQYYGNKLISIYLFDCKSPQAFDLRIKQKMRPAYVLVVMLVGSFRYYDAVRLEVVQPTPGSVYMARIAGKQYRIQIPKKESRLLLITVHPSQLAVVGEDFEALTELLDGNPTNDYYISPHSRADDKFMRKLIKLITPKFTRRKDFNKHLQGHLSEIISCLKGLMKGKGQQNYDQQKFESIINFIDQKCVISIKPPTLQIIVDHACISDDKLELLFKAAIDITPQEYLQALKMEAIKDQIITTTKRIADIASEFDYSDTASLNKPFKKHFGHSPQYYRRIR
ncbi:Helix-turn-helix domain-containing protein [bacterium A37T11]|nr:Helix-turn-helix domain-containing protein [bacterium A37T11]